MFSFVNTVIAIAALMSAPFAGSQATATPSAQPSKPQAKPHRQVCDQASQGNSQCYARVITDGKGRPAVQAQPAGYSAAQLRAAYSLSGSSSTKQTIALVDAYNDPNILSDLNTYSKTFGLPQMPSCPVATGTATSPCFQKVNQRGGTAYPSNSAGWSLEMALDVEAAHATCQTCNLLLVEASTNSYANLMAAVDRAVAMGANEVSMSWGSGEFSGESGFDSHFNHPGVAFTASSGDDGYGAQYPAASPYVTAVGGTTLLMQNNSYAGETVWDGTSSGCSTYENKFSSEDGLHVPCSQRTIADVSADADPNTGAAIYDSVRYQGQRGWFQVGGTSLAAPLIAGVYALAGGVPAGTQANTMPYSQGTTANLHDVTSGSTTNCDGTILCTAAVGYDGATGLGTPNGTGAF